jgi:hypothetical protein
MSVIEPEVTPVAEPAAPEAPAAPAAPAPVEVVEPEAPAAPAADPFEDDGVQQFDRAYVQKLREEAASHRTKAKTYTDAFEPFDEPSREVLLDLARTIAADPVAGAARMKELAALLEGEPETPAVPDPDADRPLTRADLDKIQKERDDKAAEEKVQNGIRQEVVDLGYTLDSRDHYNLLWEASHNHKGDLTAAHKALEAEKQAVIDKYLADKRGTAAGTPLAGSEGTPPANSEPITTFEQARASVEAKAKAAGFGQ